MSRAGRCSPTRFATSSVSLVSGSTDRTVRVWRAASFQEAQETHRREVMEAKEARRREAQEAEAKRRREVEAATAGAARNARGSDPAGLVVRDNLLVNGGFEQGPDPGSSRNVVSG